MSVEDGLLLSVRNLTKAYRSAGTYRHQRGTPSSGGRPPTLGSSKDCC